MTLKIKAGHIIFYDTKTNSMSKLERGMIVKAFKNLEVTAENILGFDEAKVTRGGISLKEIDYKTMKSNYLFQPPLIPSLGF